MTQFLRLGARARITPSSNICNTSDASRFLPSSTRLRAPQEWTITYRTTVRATRPGPCCLSFTQRPVRSEPAVFHRRTQEQKLDVRPALTPQATIYANHIPRRTPVSVAIFAVMYVSRPRRSNRRGEKRGMEGVCEPCVCAPHRPCSSL